MRCRSLFTFNNARFEGTGQSLSDLKETLPDLHLLEESVREIRTLSDSLPEFLESKTKSVIGSLKSISSAKGLAHLPDDVLALLFERCIELEEDHTRGWRKTDCERLALRISQVCRRFRAVAIHNPRIWAIWSGTLISHSRLYELFQDRSKNAPLRITISLNRSSLQLISSLAERLESLHVFQPRSSANGVVDDLLKIHFPRLLAMDLTSRHEDETFCSSRCVDAPLLTHLTINYMLPSVQSPHLLTDLYVKLLTMDEVTEVKLLGILRVLPSLSRLYLAVKKTQLPPGRHVQRVVLPSIISFELRNPANEGGLPLVDTIRLPNIETLQVEVYQSGSTPEDGSAQLSINSLFPFSECYPQLDTLYLDIKGKPAYYADMARVSAACPRLGQMYLELNGLWLFADVQSARGLFTSLHSVHFSYRTKLWDIRNFVKILEKRTSGLWGFTELDRNWKSRGSTAGKITPSDL